MSTDSRAYICKLCGFPSPAGVGYVAADLPAIVSADLAACPCGWSQAPTVEGVVA